ncbi:MAG: IMP dehydrogenase [Proteobacteria bacterium]|nr:IMP dehydrogenase [Pseudomonadota bacterium]
MQARIADGLTFDDVLLVPGASSVHPSETDLGCSLTPNIRLAMPLVSSPMDTVTEHRTAICMAQEGGIGFVHKNLSIAAQASEIAKVKRSESGMIVDPVTLEPEETIHEALDVMHRHHISGLPVVRGEQLVGIVTNRDLRFVKDPERPVSSIMTPGERLITVRVGVLLERAKELLHENRIEKLLVVDDHGNLRGLITIKDIEKAQRYPLANKDEMGSLRVGAAVGVAADILERAQALIDAGADLLLVDSSHGHAQSVLDALERLHLTFPEVELVGGNVATSEGAEALLKVHVSAVRCGVGPGSICTTRVVAGVGVPQLTAILDTAQVCRRQGIPLIADGGIKFSGDVTKALAAGAEAVMIGSLFAGTDESPGDLVLHQGRSFKVYRGMGSLSAMREGYRDRYFQSEATEPSKLVPEGVDARVPHRGPLTNSVHQLLGGIRAGLGLVGAADLDRLRERAQFLRVTAAGLRESHPHDVIITEEPPNYWLET